MKAILIKTTLGKVLLVALLAGGAALAQQPAHTPARPPRTPEQRADMRTRHLAKTLLLSAEQQAQVRPLLLAQAQKKESSRAAAKARRQQEVAAIQAETDAAMKHVLTDTQYETYRQQQKMQAERAVEKRRQRRGGR